MPEPEPAAPEGRTSRWLRDDPPDIRQDGDAFRIKDAVAGLASLLMQADPPWVVGLTGSWGTGKTTFAKAVCTEVSGRLDTCSIDLWSQDINNLRRTMLMEVGAAGADNRDAALLESAASIDAAVRTSSTTAEPPELKLSDALVPRRGNFLTPVWGLLLVVLAIEVFLYLDLFPGTRGFLPLASSVLGAIIVFVVLKSGLVIRIRTTQSSLAPAKEQILSADAFREIVQKAPGKKNVLVLVDNLDRLPADDALRTLSEIRAFVELDVSRCLFLIPVDRDALHVQLHLILRDDRAARDYLDKFFNLDISLALPMTVELRQWTSQRARAMFPDVSSVAGLVQVVHSASRGKPRAITRLLNRTKCPRGSGCFWFFG